MFISPLGSFVVTSVVICSSVVVGRPVVVVVALLSPGIRMTVRADPPGEGGYVGHHLRADQGLGVDGGRLKSFQIFSDFIVLS